MKFLKDLVTLTETGNDLSQLPNDVITAIKSNIRKGAEDLQQKWANALELVHKAYEVEGVQRPSPDMDGAWKQYEENLQYAVQQLAKNRGMDGDWRMSSSIFHESLNRKPKFLVTMSNLFEDNTTPSYTTECENIDTLIESITKDLPSSVKIHVSTTDNVHTVTFSKWGIKQRERVVIAEV